MPQRKVTALQQCYTEKIGRVVIEFWETLTGDEIQTEV